MELIQLKEVSKAFGRNEVLQNVNISIEEGDILGVIGRSGSGKSTLLNLITGYIQPSQGEMLYFSKVTHNAQDLNRNLHKIKKFIGFAPQRNSFYPKLTVKENLLYFGTLYGVEHQILVGNIKNLLQFLSIWDDRNKLAEELSGGMQKRLDIACSLAHKPKLLVLDEPTADLDPLLQIEKGKYSRHFSKRQIDRAAEASSEIMRSFVTSDAAKWLIDVEIVGREVPILYFDRKSRKVLSGKIDLLVKDGEKHCIVDYKTDQSLTDVMRKRYAEQMRLYRLALAESLAGRDARPPNMISRLLLVRTGEMIEI